MGKGICVEARCRHAGECGGCRWQQVDYGAQLEQKQALIEALFAPLPVQPIIPCESIWEYRNKMEFSFSQNRAKERFFGLVLAGSRGHVFNLEECFLAAPWVAELVQRVRAWWEESGLTAYHRHKNTGTLRTLTVREGKRTGDKLVMLTVSGEPAYAPSQQQLRAFVAAVQQELPTVSIFLCIQQQIKGSPTQVYEMHLAGPDHITERLHVLDQMLTFKISPTSFFQPNTFQAEVLYSTALQMIAHSPKKLILDLYCGTATIGMALARSAEQVIGIELNPHAVFDAESNKECNQIANIELICGDVGEKLFQLKEKRPDLVVVDPPRAGLSPQAITNVLSVEPKEILYISCNPRTQAENLKFFYEAGYQCVCLQPVDQFPHTPHIENIAYLTK